MDLQKGKHNDQALVNGWAGVAAEKHCRDCKQNLPITYFRKKKKKYKDSTYHYHSFLCRTCEKVYLFKLQIKKQWTNGIY